MKAWLVRWEKDETDERINACGIVLSDNFNNLFDSIDQITNPHDLEYCRIPSSKDIGLLFRWSGDFVGDDADLEFSRGKWKTFVELVGDYDDWYRNRNRVRKDKS